MKFMLNGAVTIGTMDGANIEIRDEVGDENIFIFGLTAGEVLDYYQNGGYNAWEMYHNERRIKDVLDRLVNGFFPVPADEFRNIYNSLLEHNDEFFVLKDFPSYAKAQERVDRAFRDRRQWLRKSIVNTAHAGRFSSDRTISEYAAEMWRISPVSVE